MDFEIRDVPEQPCVYMTKRLPQDQLGEFFMDAFPKVFQYVMPNGGPGGPPFGRYPEWGETDCIVEGGVITTSPLPSEGEIISGTIGGGKVVCATHIGPYEGLREAWAGLWKYVEDNGLKSAGPVFEMYMNSPGEVPESELRTDMYWPVE